MTRPSPTRPTDAELEILRILWERGPSTVRELFETVTRNRALGYTTVLKAVQVMLRKRLVVREIHGRNHVYRAAASMEATQRFLIKDLINRAFGGSRNSLILQLLETGESTSDDMQELRRLLGETD